MSVPYGISESLDNVVLSISPQEAIAFRAFLRDIIYTHTAGQREQMIQRWIPLAETLLERAGYQYIKGVITPIEPEAE
jgi:hypothetical protein